ncbi:MAG: Dihydrolipoyllysine-residue succinyltransferase component of 2-oxoglutarate dehydrogenase complex [candidate division BRC1 bacterium ADurb.BinA364]|nr:MAG: Dihydrolipoyllysine-residue succinyltransferase component of 2-oxoglutarate dehydrogenase complex [candidate division BRC1 bacterium ADurb.BinA364]
MIQVLMPQVGQDIPSAVVLEWRKRVGDPVEQGEIIAEVESEKAVFEIEAEQSGALLAIYCEAGEEGKVLEPIAVIGQPGEIPPERARADAPNPAAAPAGAGAQADSAIAAKSAARASASPAARRLAAELGVDWTRLQGSGPGGRIVVEDVEAAARPMRDASPAAQTASEADEAIPFSRLRRKIAERLCAAWRDIPHFHISMDVDMTRAAAWRDAFNAQGAMRVSFTDIAVKAAAEALRRHPAVNAHVEPERIVRKSGVHVGLAVSVEDGLLVPVIADADRKTLIEIAREARQAAEAARSGALPAGPRSTFTVTSLGMHGVREFLPIVNPPQCAILGVGAIEKRVAALEGGAFAARDMMTLTLGADHRALDGVAAARFLSEIKAILEGFPQLAEKWMMA